MNKVYDESGIQLYHGRALAFRDWWDHGGSSVFAEYLEKRKKGDEY